MSPHDVIQSYMQAMQRMGVMAPPAPPPQPTAPTQPAKPTYDTPIPAAQQSAYQSWLTQLPANLRQGGTEDYDMQGAFLGGAQPEAGHLTDQWKKPNHITFSSTSQYSGQNGEVGGQWVWGGGPRPESNWTFYPSATNLKYHTPEELKNYFKRVEEPNGNRLVLP